METIVKKGLVMKKKGEIIDDRYRCQPDPGLEGKGGEQHSCPQKAFFIAVTTIKTF